MILQPEENIHQLLFDNDCVILPSFGGFIKRNNPTVLDKHARTLKPKGATVFFNAALTHNDGLLANHIALEKKIDYSTALSLLNNWVVNTENTIQTSGKFIFGELGTFYLNAEGKKWFAPNPKLNFSKETFGLEILIAKTILSETKEENKPTTHIRNHNDIEKVITKELVVSKKKPRYVLAKIAASFLLLAGVGFVIYQFDSVYFKQPGISQADMLILEDTTPFQKKDNIPTVENDTNATIELDSDSIPMQEMNAEEPIEIHIQTQNTAFKKEDVQINIHSKDNSTQVARSNQEFYTILAGAFSQEANAQRRLDLLLKAGIDASTSKPEGSRLIRIQCGKFNSEEDALKKLENIQLLVKDAHISSYL